jgi:hypothetical protein
MRVALWENGGRPGEEAFAAAWAAGRAMSLDQAVGFALDEAGPGCA